jgi:glycosyltransferase involved in cell wall biosynthesis
MNNRRKQLVLIQPALGRYRKGFIESLVKINDTFDISIYCSPIDNAGVKSMQNIDQSINYFKVKLINIFGMFFWQSLVWPIMKLKLKRGDALVINGNPRFLSSLLISIIVKLKGVEIYWWGHAWSSTSSKLGSYIRFKLMNLFNVILYTDEEIKLTKHLIKTPVIALNNGLNINSIRKGINISESRYNAQCLELVFIGRYTKKSNFELIIEALLLLPLEDIKQVNLKVIGDIEAEAIREKHPKSSTLNIEYFGEIWDENEISIILKDSHIFIYPGSVGLSLIHAFALGLPAILHNKRLDHMPEIGAFIDGYNGLSFNYGCAKSLSESVKFCKNNKEVIRVYSKNAYSTVSDSFNTEDMAVRFLNFIR